MYGYTDNVYGYTDNVYGPKTVYEGLNCFLMVLLLHICTEAICITHVSTPAVWCYNNVTQIHIDLLSKQK